MSIKQDVLAFLKEEFLKPYKLQGQEKRLELLSSTYDILLKPQATTKNLNLTHATIRYWENKGYLLFPITRETDEWRKFSLLECFWIEILKKITKMGCSLDILAPKIIYAYENQKGINDTVFFDATKLKTNDTENINADLLTRFFAHVSTILQLKGKYSIHLFDDSCLFAAENGIEKTDAVEIAYKTMHKTGISICISDIVFPHEINTAKHVLRTNIFTPQETEILNLLSKNELKELTIKLEDGKPVSLELVEKFNLSNNETSKRLKEFFFTPYQSITAVTNGGKTIAFERTTKQKLN